VERGLVPDCCCWGSAEARHRCDGKQVGLHVTTAAVMVTSKVLTPIPELLHDTKVVLLPASQHAAGPVSCVSLQLLSLQNMVCYAGSSKH
jgi:hypothetical protein